ncbi:MAG: hypothetical protein LBT59_23075 [Clostridiales bacterium]|jgi:hypothetical protein|nr:hypothetical protein [Clostridiales bacterium]
MKYVKYFFFTLISLVLIVLVLYRRATTFGEIYFAVNKDRLDECVETIVRIEETYVDKEVRWAPVDFGIQPSILYNLKELGLGPTMFSFGDFGLSKLNLEALGLEDFDLGAAHAYYTEKYGAPIYVIFFPVQSGYPIRNSGYLYSSTGTGNTDIELRVGRGGGVATRIDSNWFEVVGS